MVLVGQTMATFFDKEDKSDKKFEKFEKKEHFFPSEAAYYPGPYYSYQSPYLGDMYGNANKDYFVRPFPESGSGYASGYGSGYGSSYASGYGSGYGRQPQASQDYFIYYGKEPGPYYVSDGHSRVNRHSSYY